MNANISKNQEQFGAICTVANRLRKEMNISQKEAFARAKEMLKNANALAKTSMNREQFVKLLEQGSVKFTYKSPRGMVVTTKGTLKDEMITKNRKIAGAKTPKNPEGIAYYDRIHGIYRTVLMENLISVHC